MANEKIMIVDDDVNICELLRLYLEKEGYATKIVNDGMSAVDTFKAETPDLVLLDIMLPGLDGWQVCREIRKFSDKPIIMLTAKGETFDKVLGLELGADDYVTKPFSPSELLARVDSLYRRVALAQSHSENNFKEELKSGEFTLNLRNRALMKSGKMIELTQVEFQIMEYFFSNPGVALDRIDILNHVWGDAYVGEDKIVDVNIRRLRMKVEDEPSNPKHIITVWGLGYKWDSGE